MIGVQVQKHEEIGGGVSGSTVLGIRVGGRRENGISF